MTDQTHRRVAIAILLGLSRGTPLEEIRVDGRDLRPSDVTNAIHAALDLVNLQVGAAAVPQLPDANRSLAALEHFLLRPDPAKSQSREQGMSELQEAIRAAAPAVEQLAQIALARLLGPESARCRPVASLLAILAVVAFGALVVAYPIAGWAFFGALFLGSLGLSIWIEERKKRPSESMHQAASASLGDVAVRTVEWWIGRSLVEQVEKEGVTTLAMLFTTGLMILLRWFFDWGLIAVWVVAAVYAAFMLTSIWGLGNTLCSARRFMTSPLYSVLNLRIMRVVIYGGEDLATGLGSLVLVYVVAKLTVLLWLASSL